MILALILAACTQGKHLEAGKCAADVPVVDPTFKRTERGWLPICPAGTELIRVIRPDESKDKTPCFWGVGLMRHKSSQGEFACRSIGALPKYPACPIE